MAAGGKRHAIGETGVVRQEREVDLHGGNGAEPGTDLAHELVGTERGERVGNFPLELERLVDQPFALDDVEVRVRGSSRRGVPRVRVAVAPDACRAGLPERLLDRACPRSRRRAARSPR